MFLLALTLFSTYILWCLGHKTEGTIQLLLKDEKQFGFQHVLWKCFSAAAEKWERFHVCKWFSWQYKINIYGMLLSIMLFWAMVINSTVHNTCFTSSSCPPSPILFYWHVTANGNAPASSHYTSLLQTQIWHFCLSVFFLFWQIIIVSYFYDVVFL